MRLSGDLFVFGLFLGLCVLVSNAGATERLETPGYSQGIGQEEAVVTRVERDRIQLRSTSEGSREFFVARKDNGELRSGDRVVVEGTTIKKLGPVSNPDAKPSPTDEGTAKAGDTQKAAETPDPNPATGGPSTPPLP
jgi:hypothetical protein